MGYEYGYDAGSAVATGIGAVIGVAIFLWIIVIAFGIFSIICNWKVFKKAGKNGWEAIVPIYNIVVLLAITNLPLWYLALFLIPVGNIIATVLIYIELAKKFGQSTGFGIGLALLNPIFMAILAFNKNYIYQGNTMMNGQPMYNQNMNQMQQPMYNQNMNQMQQPMNNQNMNQMQQPMNNQNMNQMPQQPMQNSVCSRCGAPVNAGDKFCMSCGNQIL